MPQFRSQIFSAWLVVGLRLSCVLPVGAAEQVDFDKQIRPLLADACFHCHGPDEEVREADLRLDQREGLFGDLGEYYAVVPGDLEASELIARITSDDEDLRMPPAESGKQLTAEQIELLKHWVEQGAPWNEHWAFTPPQKPPTPAVDQPDWAQNPIDRFVLARLEGKSLAPSAKADRRTLARRLTLDLAGLPPTTAEIHDFLNDNDSHAYERLVDRLLDSPHFGERLAMPWLDQARYADTNGYSIDGGRHMWLWRDWVIDAYNKNMPFDQFITEQLAGDLLPQATESQRIATGFSRNHMITHEGGTIAEENLVNYVADRVRTTSEVFLGLTMGCAQCHDHKYDPITQRDYYRFFAFFNTVEDKGIDGNAGRNAVPRMSARTVLQNGSELGKLLLQLADLKSQLERPHSGQDAWEAKTRYELAQRGKQLQLHPLRVAKVTEPNQGGSFDIVEDHIVRVTAPKGRSPSVLLRAGEALGKIRGLRVEFLPDESFPHGGSGYGKDILPGGFVLTSFSLSATELPSDQVDLYGMQPIAGATASRSDPKFSPTGCLDPRDHNGWSPGDAFDRPQHITFTFKQPIDSSETPNLTAMLVWGWGKAGNGKLLAGRYRFFAVTGNDDGTNVPEVLQRLLKVAPTARTDAEAAQVRDYYVSVASEPELAALRHAIANLEDRIDDQAGQHFTMVMNTAENPRKTHILNRGQYNQPGEQVFPGVPASLPSLPEGAPQNRLGLAQWLVQPNHPLTSRVAVNRLWQMLFGQGLVSSSENFGLQGQPPTHPQLLDWLAVEFVESGWDVKALVKLMVMSATYQQQSSTSGDLVERDPLNQLLARGPRNRLDAERVRDAALQISGLLNTQVGGRSAKPYQPPGLWREVSHFGSSPATSQVFVQDHGEKLYRRSMYTYWKRTVPPPAMVAFDAPNRELCTMRRQVTNTPLQALVLLNDPQFVEASRAFAERIVHAVPDQGIEGRLRFAIEEATGRLPQTKEIELLSRTYERQFARWKSDPEAARAYLVVGEWPTNPALDPIEHAAWTSLASLILNLSEVISTK